MPPAMTPSLHRMAGDERLARMVTSGNDGAFSALYDRYHDVLVRYCRSLVRDDQDALDAFQSTMLNALRALREDRRRAPVRPWLFRIAHNESISVLRRRPASEPLDDRQIGTVDVHRTAEDREALAGLLEDLGSLTEHQRGALLLRELGGLAYEDVASVLDTTPLAARQAVFAARASLHDQREGRELPCAMVQRRLSDTDRRASRTRAIRAHLRRCDDCRGFATAIGRRRRAAVLVPIPPAFASGGLLTSILDAGAGGAGATVVGGGAVASGLVAKAAVALSAAVMATGAAERGTGVVHRATGGGTAEAQAEPAPKAAAAAAQPATSSTPTQRASAAATTTSTTPATRTASDATSTHSAPTSGDDDPTLDDDAGDRDPVRLSASDRGGEGDDGDARAWGGGHHRGSYDGASGMPGRDTSAGEATSEQPSRPIAARPRRPAGAAMPMAANTTTDADATETTTPAAEPTTTATTTAPATTTTATTTTETAAPEESSTTETATTPTTTTTTPTTPAAPAE